ncbi:hypothetical protein FH972_023539 [Carpinus fangiana]|uniref:Uncharacterized protein n=1 Tax=Carpinus fangiana TaxID=176857 RepID=A0A5N6KW30_9ROSI|nr:hypothetical protein FH972_023539 [Carpinus fangiana]
MKHHTLCAQGTGKETCEKKKPLCRRLLHLLALGGHVLQEDAVVLTLDVLDHQLGLLGLAGPLGGAGLCVAAEELVVGLAVGAAEAVPEGGELAVVVVEVAVSAGLVIVSGVKRARRRGLQVMHGVAGGTVDDEVVGGVLAVVDHDGPQVHKGEEADVGELGEGEDEGEDVVGDALGEAVERVEGVAGKGGRHYPLVVGLVQVLVDAWVVQAAVDPVDEEVGEADEEGDLQDVVPQAWAVGGAAVHLRVAAHLEEKGRQSAEGHQREGGKGLLDLQAHLVLEVLGVLEGGLVEDQEIGGGGDGEVEDDGKDPGDGEEADDLPVAGCMLWDCGEECGVDSVEEEGVKDLEDDVHVGQLVPKEGGFAGGANEEGVRCRKVTQTVVRTLCEQKRRLWRGCGGGVKCKPFLFSTFFFFSRGNGVAKSSVSGGCVWRDLFVLAISAVGSASSGLLLPPHSLSNASMSRLDNTVVSTGLYRDALDPASRQDVWQTAKVEHKGYAYATLITRASYLAGVIILAHSLRKHGNSLPLVILYTDSLSDDSLQAINLEADSLNLTLFPVEELCPPAAHAPMSLIAARFADTWTKLRVFELTDYDRVCYLDADMLIVRPGMDKLVLETRLPSLDWIAATHVCACNKDHDPWADPSWTEANCAFTLCPWPKEPCQPSASGPPPHRLLNGGMFIFNPSKALWDDVKRVLATDVRLATYKFPDQDFLASYFEGRWLAVNYKYNALKTMRNWHPDMWRDGDVINVHYIVDKPWARRIASDGVAGYLGLDGTTHAWWWEAFSAWEAEREGQSVLELVRKYVARPLHNSFHSADEQDGEGSIAGSDVQAFTTTLTDAARGVRQAVNATNKGSAIGPGILYTSKSPWQPNTRLQSVIGSGMVGEEWSWRIAAALGLKTCREPRSIRHDITDVASPPVQGDASVAARRSSRGRSPTDKAAVTAENHFQASVPTSLLSFVTHFLAAAHCTASSPLPPFSALWHATMASSTRRRVPGTPRVISPSPDTSDHANAGADGSYFAPTTRSSARRRGGAQQPQSTIDEDTDPSSDDPDLQRARSRTRSPTQAAARQHRLRHAGALRARLPDLRDPPGAAGAAAAHRRRRRRPPPRPRPQPRLHRLPRRPHARERGPRPLQRRRLVPARRVGRAARVSQGRRRHGRRAAQLVRHGGVDVWSVVGALHAARAPWEEPRRHAGGVCDGRAGGGVVLGRDCAALRGAGRGGQYGAECVCVPGPAGAACGGARVAGLVGEPGERGWWRGAGRHECRRWRRRERQRGGGYLWVGRQHHDPCTMWGGAVGLPEGVWGCVRACTSRWGYSRSVEQMHF